MVPVVELGGLQDSKFKIYKLRLLDFWFWVRALGSAIGRHKLNIQVQIAVTNVTAVHGFLTAVHGFCNILVAGKL